MAGARDELLYFTSFSHRSLISWRQDEPALMSTVVFGWLDWLQCFMYSSIDHREWSYGAL